MSDSGHASAQASDVDQDVASARTALTTALQTCEARGANRRNFRIAIWQACITLALDAGEADVVVGFLQELSARTRGQGANADAPPSQIEPRDLPSRLADASDTAQVILSCFDPLLEDLESRNKDGVSVALTTCFAFLADSWGPAHLRRIIGDQIDAIEGGSLLPIFPSEPSTLNLSFREPAAERRPARAPIHSVGSQAPLPTPAAARPRPHRRIDLHVDVDLISEGRRGAYAFAATLLFDGVDRRETRESHGMVARAGNARRLWLTAALEALGSLAPVKGDAIRITVTDPFLVNEAIVGARRQVTDETAMWSEIDALCASADIEWSYSAQRLRGGLAQRCDFLLHSRLSERDAATA